MNQESQTWSDRVSRYVEELAVVAETIDLILDNTRIGASGIDPDEMTKSTSELATSLEHLESKVAERDVLLRADDAPVRGLTLSEKLRTTMKIEDARLAKRCQELSETIQGTQQRAISLFVCQFHMAELTTDIVHLLTGTQASGTYEQNPSSEVPKSSGQGGLFDEAA